MKKDMWFSDSLGELVIESTPRVQTVLPEENLRRRDEIIRGYQKTGNAVAIVRIIGGSTADFNIK